MLHPVTVRGGSSPVYNAPDGGSCKQSQLWLKDLLDSVLVCFFIMDMVLWFNFFKSSQIYLLYSQWNKKFKPYLK